MVKDLKEVFARFSNEDVCRQYLVDQRWKGKPVCPYCNSDKSYIIEGGKRFKCGNSDCYKKYSVTVGTIFHASNIHLTTWFPAMYLIASHKKGISSVQLAKDLGVTQKTAWFMLHRVRQSLKETNPEMLSGTIEVDETYMGKKFRSDFKGLTEDQVTEAVKAKFKGRGAVMAIAQRDGKLLTKVFPDMERNQAQQTIKDNVVPGSKVYTDQSGLYMKGLEEYERGTVKHSKPNPVFASGDIHVNNVEAFWSVMKRGLYGIYHQVSYKHLQRYCDEFSYRYNSRKVKDGERFTLTLQRIETRLTYKQLVYGESKENKA